MLEQYKKTFVATQAIILMVTTFLFFHLHRMWLTTGVFFLVMQVGALLGAMWATRLRRKLRAQPWC